MQKVESYSHWDVEATSLLEQAAAPGWPRGLNEVEEQNGRSRALIVIRCSGVVGWQRVVGTPPQIRRATACGGVHIKIVPPTSDLLSTISPILFITGTYNHVTKKYDPFYRKLLRCIHQLVSLNHNFLKHWHFRTSYSKLMQLFVLSVCIVCAYCILFVVLIYLFFFFLPITFFIVYIY